jgi:DNA-binding transcriptional MerR regulator
MNQLTHQADYLFEKIFLQYPNIIEEIRKPLYKTSDTVFDSRKLTTLAQSGLLPDTREDNKGWRKYNLNELLYLEVIKKSRDFNMEYTQLYKVQELFFEKKTNYIKIGEVTPTEQALILLLTSQVPLSIRLYSDGEISIADNRSFKPDILDKEGSSLYIDLNNIFYSQISDFKKLVDFESNYNLRDFEFDYLAKVPSRKVYALFRFIDQEDIKTVEIEKQDGGTYKVSFTQMKNNENPDRETIMKYFDETHYGDIEVFKRDGKVAGLVIKDVYKI